MRGIRQVMMFAMRCRLRDAHHTLHANHDVGDGDLAQQMVITISSPPG